MPREALDPEARTRLSTMAGPIAASRYPLLLARNRAVLESFLDDPGVGKDGLLGTALREALRVESARLAGCDTCQIARYDGGPGEAFLSCMSDRSNLPPRDALALDFLERMHLDHLSIDAAVYRRLGDHFTVAEIIELGSLCAQLVGGHRWLHTLDMMGTDPPVFPYEG
jgi:alkylhydroperoxidase family enzyme